MTRNKQRPEETANDGRRIQGEVDRLEQNSAKTKSKPGKPMQVGEREYPAKFPAQHLEKSGSEKDLRLKPMYQAPSYEGSRKLQDMVALITGGDSGIGRAVAVLYAREGADVAICYLEESNDAEETKRAVEKEGRRAILIAGY